MAMTFFKRAANFDADDIARSVQPEVAARGNRTARVSTTCGSVDATQTAVGSSRAISDAKLGPDSTPTRTPGAEFLLDDLGGTEQRVLLRVPWPH